MLEALSQAGFRVCQAASGEEGLQKIIAEKPSLAILDMKMPGMSGVEFLRELHRRACSLPVIVVTAYEDKELAEQARKLGVRYFLHKPFDLSHLYHLVDAALAQSCYSQLEIVTG
ncbi:MAG: response regulator [Thermanaeromonas sp.]|nr:response regulator [Thermanaeromonas sp.]